MTAVRNHYGFCRNCGLIFYRLEVGERGNTLESVDAGRTGFVIDPVRKRARLALRKASVPNTPNMVFERRRKRTSLDADHFLGDSIGPKARSTCQFPESPCADKFLDHCAGGLLAHIQFLGDHGR